MSVGVNWKIKKLSENASEFSESVAKALEKYSY